MNGSILLRGNWGTSKWVLIGSLATMCVSCLLAEDVKRVPEVEAMKAIAFKTKPAYNGIARQMKLSGHVALDVLVAENGTVETVTVVKGNPILAKMAVGAVKQWKFIPFKTDGKAIKVVSELDLVFTNE